MEGEDPEDVHDLSDAKEILYKWGYTVTEVDEYNREHYADGGQLTFDFKTRKNKSKKPVNRSEVRKAVKKVAESKEENNIKK